MPIHSTVQYSRHGRFAFIARISVARTSHLFLLLGIVTIAVALPVQASGENFLGIDLCQTLSQRTFPVRVKPVAKPPYLRLFKEPGFGTRVIRISNSGPGAVTKPGRDAAQAWNVDESKMILHHYDATGAHSVLLLNGHTFENIGKLKLPTIASENIYWSHQDPNLLIYMPDSEADAGKLSQVNLTNGEMSVIKDFSPYCEKKGLPSQGGLLAAPSMDGDLIGFRCGLNGDKSLAVSYQVSNDTVTTLRTGSDTAWSVNNSPAPLPSGDGFLLDGKLLDQNLKQTRQRLDIGDHLAPTTMGMSPNTESVLFQSALKKSPSNCNNDIWSGIGLVIKHNINEGSCQSLVTQTKGYPATPPGTQLAANAYLNPRWLAVSSVGYDQFDSFTSNRVAPLLFSEVIMLDTDKQKPKPCRLAHHRTYGDNATRASYEPSLGRPNVSLSPRATRVLFGSDWYDSGMVDSYVVVLPAYTSLDLEGIWVDVHNSNIKTVFSQLGTSVNFQRNIPNDQTGQSTLIKGSGSINEGSIKLRYSYFRTASREVNGTCTGNQSADYSKIALSCTDDRTGHHVSYTLVREK